MPTYFVVSPAGRLSASEKARIAQDITRIHSAVTGAQSFFAQVFFEEVAPGNHFMGGVPVTADGVFVSGHIRAGRTAEQKTGLIRGIVDAVAEATGLSKHHIWAYVAELPPGQMIEYGHVLPEPGAEKAWLEALPAADREFLERLGR